MTNEPADTPRRPPLSGENESVDEFAPETSSPAANADSQVDAAPPADAWPTLDLPADARPGTNPARDGHTAELPATPDPAVTDPPVGPANAETARPAETAEADRVAAAPEAATARADERDAAPADLAAAAADRSDDPEPVALVKPGDPPLAPPTPPPGPLWPDADRLAAAQASDPAEDLAAAAAAGAGAAPSAAEAGVAAGAGVGAGSAGRGAEAGAGTGVRTDWPPTADPSWANGAYPGAVPGAGPAWPPSDATWPPTGSVSGLTARFGLARPLTGRYLAGVCAAVARATNTDPVLWRVMFAVLTVFGGIGLLAYLVGWLLIPADGDTASPAEAVLGKGRSRTSGPVAVIGAAATLLMFLAVASAGLRPAVIGALIILGVAVLLSRGSRQRTSAGGQMPEFPPPVPPSADMPAGAGPTAGHPYPGTPVTPPRVPETPPAPPQTARPPLAPHGPFAPLGPMPPLGPTAVPPWTPAGATRPPFAPHGPYGGYAGYGTPVSGGPVLAYPGLPHSAPPASAPPKKKPKRPRSRLGRATISLALLAVGVLAVFDVTAVDPDPSVYPAVILTVLGLGLVAGAWVGRARWLIPFAVITSLVLAGTTADEMDGPGYGGNEETWRVTSVATLQQEYVFRQGETRLDLSEIDFTATTPNTPPAQTYTVRVSKQYGDLRITLPEDVDVEITVELRYGEAHVFDNRWSAIGSDTPKVIQDVGDDGPGGPKLIMTIDMQGGELGVER
ncbi:hypothetical protein Val02_16490 [Virgisporangium aliadipatigenens]|uniref:Phage shock protein PspC N-terminal domain-containing protein n=1 Tax=Virgisporangium aliadipatigenens TaxID=741659 RepID=A0A8J3YIE5_9ACTN|nr:PspC domain-containing protein [Virgisporangium aliadipatigenens]GIJ44763.1 hypothetical protein Val02_16490 [Virgisporangium aliadipatigenens]